MENKRTDEFKKKITEALKSNDFFENLREEEINQLCSIARIKEYTKGEIVFSEAQQSHYLFLVDVGSFILQIKSSDYKVFEEGELFGEIGIINNAVRSGTVRAREQSMTIEFCGNRLFQEEFINPVLALKITRALAKKITNYLKTREQISTATMIENGEDEFVEFKSSIRYNIKAQRNDKAIEMASIKTIAAFLNSSGGTLLIGVKDDGTILGVEQDGFPNEDKYLLHLTNLIKNRIGPLFIEFIHFDFVMQDGKSFIRIDCEPATTPAYVKDGEDDHFYIRTGPATTNLRLSKVYDYILKRFVMIS